MIAASRIALVGALALTLMAHGLGLHASFRGESVDMEGASGGAQATIGNSFEDMTAGAVAANSATEVTEPEPVDEPIETETAEDVTDPVETDQPVEDVEPPDETDLTETQDVAEDVPVEETVEAETQDVAEDVPVKETVEAETTPMAMAAVVPISPIQATETEPIEAAQPELAETLEPVEENTSAVARSLRPKPRTPEFEKKHEPEPPAPQPRQQAAQPRQQPVQQQSAATRQGDANQNAIRGSTTSAQQQSNTSAGTGAATQQGNAAASNYPGKVMRRISRVPRPNVGVRAKASVTFRVSASGGLAGVSISRSSGNARLDQAALALIRRAAPFPPPPPGAQRSFSISIEGR